MKTFFGCLPCLAVVFSWVAQVAAEPLVMGSAILFDRAEIAGGMPFASAPESEGWAVPPGDASVFSPGMDDAAEMGLSFSEPDPATNLAVNVFANDALDPLNLWDAQGFGALPFYTVTSFQTVFTPSDVLPASALMDRYQTKILMCALEEDDGLPFLYVSRRIINEYGEVMTNGLMRTDLRVETNRVYTVFLESKGYQDPVLYAWFGDPGFTLYRISLQVEGEQAVVATENLGVYAPASVDDFDYAAIGDWVFGYSEDSWAAQQYRQLCFFGSGWVDTIELGESAPEPRWKVKFVDAESAGEVKTNGVAIASGTILPGLEPFTLTVAVTNSRYRVEIAAKDLFVTGDFSSSPISVPVPAAAGYQTLTVTFIDKGAQIPPMPRAFEAAYVSQEKYDAWYTAYGPFTPADDQLGAYLFNISPEDALPALKITAITRASNKVAISVAAEKADGSFVDLTAINGVLCVKTSDDLTVTDPKAGFGGAVYYRDSTLFGTDGTPATISEIDAAALKRFVRAVILAVDPASIAP